MRNIFIVLLFILSWNLYSQQSLKIAVISDTHYLSSKLTQQGVALNEYETTTGRNINDLHLVLDQVIAKLKTYQPDLLLIPGDITNHGERDSHIDFVEVLKPLADNGTRIFVIPGNHDVNIPNSKMYVGNIPATTSNVLAEEFTQIYAPYGYATPLKRDTSSLSYLAEINDSIWLLAIDSNRHPEYKTSSISAGRILPETLQWSLEILREAKKKDILVIGMMHHGLVEHRPYQSVFLPDYLIDNWKSNAQLLADNGLKIIFTGHFHSNDVTLLTSPSGNTIYDIETGSLAGYPFPFRLMTLSDNVLKIETKLVESILGKPCIQKKYLQKTEELTRRIAQSKINSLALPIPLNMEEALVDLLVKMQLLHLKGDEKIDNEMLQLIKHINELIGDPDADFSSFELDFHPADNSLEIVL